MPAVLESVQVLRAIAALAVVTYHIPLLQNGRWGVDIFFVISGFIMCHVTRREGADFFTKRLIRVVPLYWAGTLGVFLLALAAPQLLQHTTADPLDLLRSLLFIPFQKGEVVQPVLFLGWTLNYEMFFYAIFALSMRASHEHRAAVCSALLAAIVITGTVAQPDSVVLNFYSAPIVLEFALGMGCYALYTGPSSRPLPWAVLAVALLACLPFIDAWAHREIRWGLPAAGVLYCTLKIGVRMPAPALVLGDASYSLYLFHPYITLAFGRISVFHEASAAGFALIAAAILLCCAMAVLCYRFYEKPVSGFLRRRLTGVKS